MCQSPALEADNEDGEGLPMRGKLELVMGSRQAGPVVMGVWYEFASFLSDLLLWIPRGEVVNYLCYSEFKIVNSE